MSLAKQIWDLATSDEFIGEVGNGRLDIRDQIALLEMADRLGDPAVKLPKRLNSWSDYPTFVPKPPWNVT